MDNITNWWQKFLNNVRVRRTVVLLLIIVVLYLFRSMMTTILLTFIFTFLVTKLVFWIKKKVKIPSPILVIIIYAVIVAAAVLTAFMYGPKIIEQSISYSKALIAFYQQPHSINNPLVRKYVVEFLNNFDLAKAVKASSGMIIKYITSLGATGVSLFMSILLSFFFTLEEKQIGTFSKKFLDCKIGWFFQDIYYFAKTFVKTFGVVLEAQFFIAICNTVITTVCLAFMGIPQLAILAVMIFFLSLIPVAGVLISVIPLSLIGYTVGGFRYVVYIIIIISLVHCFEAYVLNPKFMSAKTKLPIFFTFVVLLFGEVLFGTWGLIVSVPIFTFFLDILGVQKVDAPDDRKPGIFKKYIIKFKK